MEFGSLVEEVNAIKSAAIEFSARAHLNKAQVISWIGQASSHPELPPLLLIPTTSYVLPKMPEEAFCYVVSVSDCTFHKKTHDCECFKTMMFGKTSEVCTRITKQSTPNKCKDDWAELSKECVVSSLILCNKPTAEPDVFTPPTDCPQLERQNICYKNRTRILEDTLIGIISTLTGKTLDQVVKIMGKNVSAALCDLP